jgi:hypothetical protein
MNKGSRKEMNVIGIDVSKAKLDCAWLGENNKLKVKVFPNALAGWAGLVEWSLKNTGLPISGLHFVMDDCMDAGGRAMQEQLPRRRGFTMGNWRLTSMTKGLAYPLSIRHGSSFMPKA